MKTFKIDKFNKFLSSIEKESEIFSSELSSTKIDKHISYIKDNYSPSLVYYEKMPLFPVLGKAEMSNFLYDSDSDLIEAIKTIELEVENDKYENLENLSDTDLIEQIIEEDIEKITKQLKNK